MASLDMNETIATGDTTFNVTSTPKLFTGVTVRTGSTSTPSLGVYGIIYVIIGIVGIVGNLLALTVIVGHKQLRKRIPNLFLVNQSVLDLVVGSMLIFTTGLSLVDTTGMTYSASLAFCRIITSRFVFTAPLLASNWNVMALAVERYLEICHPIRHKVTLTRRKLYVVFAAVWIFGYGFKAINSIPVSGLINGVCVVGGLQTPTGRKANVIGNIAVEFAIPVTVIFGCYFGMYRVTSKISANSAIGPTVQMIKVSRNIQKVMMLIVVTLVLSTCPKQISLVFYAINASLVDLNGLVYGLCVFINYSNCCFNPFIYLFKYPEFRRGIKIVILRSKLTTAATDASISAIAN